MNLSAEKRKRKCHKHKEQERQVPRALLISQRSWRRSVRGQGGKGDEGKESNKERERQGETGSRAYIVESLDFELNLILVIAGILALASCAFLLLLLFGNRLIPAQANWCRGQLARPLLLTQILLAIDQQLRLEGVFAYILILVSATVVEHEADDLQLRRPHSTALKVWFTSDSVFPRIRILDSLWQLIIIYRSDRVLLLLVTGIDGYHDGLWHACGCWPNFCLAFCCQLFLAFWLITCRCPWDPPPEAPNSCRIAIAIAIYLYHFYTAARPLSANFRNRFPNFFTFSRGLHFTACCN